MDRLITAIRETLVSEDVPVKCAIVHGSQTTGWAGPDSDVDLIVFSGRLSHRGDAWLTELLAPVGEQFGARIDAMHIAVDPLDDVAAELETIEGAWPLFRFAAIHGVPVIGSLDSVLSARTMEQLRRPINHELSAQLYAFGQLAGGGMYVNSIGESARAERRLRRQFRDIERSPIEMAEATENEAEAARMAALKISQAIHAASTGHKRRGDGDDIVRAAAERIGVPAEPLVEIVALGGEIDAKRLAIWKRRLSRFLEATAGVLATETVLPAEEWPALFLPYPSPLPLPSSARLDRIRRFTPDDFLRLADLQVESAYEQTWTATETDETLSSWLFTFGRGSASIHAEVIAGGEPTPAAVFAALFFTDWSRARTTQALKHLLGGPALGVATLHVNFAQTGGLPHAAQAWIPW